MSGEVPILDSSEKQDEQYSGVVDISASLDNISPAPEEPIEEALTEPTLSEMSQRLEELSKRYSEQVGTYMRDVNLGAAWAYYRQPHEIKADADDKVINSIKDKELELDQEGIDIFNYFYVAAGKRINEIWEGNEPLQKLLHIQGMYEHLTVQYQKGAGSVSIVSVGYEGDKTTALVVVPAELEEYFLLVSATNRLSLETYNKSTKPDQSWMKLPSFLALLWVDHILTAKADKDHRTGYL